MTTASGALDEETREKSTRLIGYFLLIGFFFPVWMTGFGISKMVFVNIEGLGKGNFLATLDLLLPLIAGIAVLVAGRKLEDVVRATVILGAGLVWALLSFFNANTMISSGLSRYNPNTFIFFFVLLSIIGVYVGARLVSTTNHITGRLIGGISGIVFMAFALLPLGQGSKPMFFSLFDIFKAGRISGAFSVLGVVLVGVSLCYLYASLIAALNLGERPGSERTATNAYKIVFFATVALPVSFLLILMFSGAGFMILVTSIIKLTLLLGGFVGAIAIGSLDLVDQFLPKTLKGSDLLDEPQPIEVNGQPPNIWNG